jgi:hypothetical protein
VHSADGWRAVLEPVVARCRGIVKRSISAATRPSRFQGCTSSSEAEAATGYPIGLPADRALQDKIGYLPKRPVGRPPLLRELPLSGTEQLQRPEIGPTLLPPKTCSWLANFLRRRSKGRKITPAPGRNPENLG